MIPDRSKRAGSRPPCEKENMKEQHLRDLLENVRNGELSVEEGLVQLKDYPYHDLGFATVDHHRPMRQGFPEVIFGEGKTTPQIISIMSSLRDRGDDILATRVSPEKGEQLLAEFPEAVYYATAGTLTLSKEPVREETGLCHGNLRRNLRPAGGRGSRCHCSIFRKSRRIPV